MEIEKPEMKALIVDNFPDKGLLDLKDAGIQVSYDPKLKGINLAARIYDM